MDEATHLLTPPQLEALASAPRRQVVEALAAASPSTIRDIAARTGLSVTMLYRHLQRLTEVGLVREEGARADGRRAATYTLVAPRLSSSAAGRSIEGQTIYGRVARRYAAGAGRAMAAAIARGEVRLGGPDANAAVARLALCLDAEGLKALHRALAAFIAEAEAAGRTTQDGGEPVELTVILAPGRRRRS